MRVGVYVDGYNLYYGGRKHCGRGTAGWRWLDVRALAESLLGEQAANWPGAHIDRIVYCTARISSAHNASGSQDQDVYLKALLAAGSVDHIEYGNYISKVIKRPLATEGNRGRPVLVQPEWPIKVQAQGQPVVGACFMASVATFEEKALTSTLLLTCSSTCSVGRLTRSCSSATTATFVCRSIRLGGGCRSV
ncbi:hypothetical protein [Lentzea aerocolonigenes]|uniref:hypothetical protein n=1 Tax=Lentzea aerocolonigenes TaxID=68170 RepID=UPI00191BE9A0|nr:hypothetical protein [Lentzea aerocolonigenes]